VTGCGYCNDSGADGSAAEASLEFGRFRVLLRRRLLIANGVPTALGMRAFELLLAWPELFASKVIPAICRVPSTSDADAFSPCPGRVGDAC
jgi:hypothetical protein